MNNAIIPPLNGGIMKFVLIFIFWVATIASPYMAGASSLMTDSELLAASKSSPNAADHPVVVSVVGKEGQWGFRIEGIIFPEGRLGEQMDAAIALGKKKFNTEPGYIELNSAGGLHNDAKVVAGLIYLAKLNTRVVGKDQCSSACVLLLMSGRSRSVGEETFIGLHQHAIMATHNMSESQAVQELLYDYFRFAALGSVNPHIIGYMTSMPHDSIAQLPYECVVSMKLDNSHKGGQNCAYSSEGLFPVLGKKEFGSIPTP